MSKTKKIILIASLVIVAAAAGWYGFKKYKEWIFWRKIKLEADQFTSEQNRLKSLIEADTYGGKTPQETLNMFIKAVEVGDYELASKYFVVEKQGDWKNRLQTLETKNIKWLADNLKLQIEKYTGYYSSDQKIYTIKKPAFTELIIYPSNLWKINEI
ncbi:MAG: hypothetical protein HYW71_02355 [Candidatus Niyogibacteria bacterium]|nr:hypothetical protein [Candidatus Niyogibacteria bacterium]